LSLLASLGLTIEREAIWAITPKYSMFNNNHVDDNPDHHNGHE